VTDEINDTSREVLDVVSEAIKIWKSNNSPESIHQSVQTALDQNRDRIVAGLLGFKETYPGGPWEIEHSSQFVNDDSPASKYITSQGTYAIEQFFNNCPMPYMDWNMEEALRKEYEEEFKLQFGNVMR